MVRVHGLFIQLARATPRSEERGLASVGPLLLARSCKASGDLGLDSVSDDGAEAEGRGGQREGEEGRVYLQCQVH